MNKLDQRNLRNALGKYITGVTVVTCADQDGVKHGFTANSFTSVSLDPPLVLVCLAKSAVCHDAFLAAESFAINILAENQTDISGAFAKRGGDKYQFVKLRKGGNGSPLIANTAAWLDCDEQAKIDMGDHTILVGRVRDFGYDEHTPLGYCDGAYVSFATERHAADLTEDRIGKVGVILRHENRILLLREDERLMLPTAAFLGEKNRRPGSLYSKLEAVGAHARLDFIYSLARDPDSGRVHLYYRGELVPPFELDARKAALVPIEDVPWDLIGSSKYRMMLERYVSEAKQTRFGIFYGSTTSGSVEKLADY